MLTKLLISLAVLLTPSQLCAQTQPAPPISKIMMETATSELDAVLVDSVKLDDKLAIVQVKARAAALVSLEDPARSDILFREIWNFVNRQADTDVDKERLRTLILKQVFPRNPKLAKQLLSDEPQAAESSLGMRATGHDPNLNRRAKLANQLVDENPRAASEILERTLPIGMTPAGLNALLRLREREALLSDFVVGKALDGLRTQPDLVALSGLHLLSVYLFPEGNTVELNSSLQSLQIQYFSTTYDTLRASLAASETTLLKEQQYTKADLGLRSLYQARMSLTLAALAPRFQPGLVPELNLLANKLGSRLPEDVAQMAKLTSARLSGNRTVSENPELAIPIAIQSGEFDEAWRLIDDLKNDEMRKMYSELLVKVEAKDFLARSDIPGALTRIRKVEDQSARLAFYLEALKQTQKTHDAVLLNTIISEARSLIPPVDRNGLHVRALLAFASQLAVASSKDEAVEFLAAAVAAMNSLPSVKASAKDSAMDLAWAEINDPLSLLGVPEFARAFSSVGIVDLERAIIEARKIGVRSVSLLARLEAIGDVMRIDSRKPKQKPATKAIATHVGL